MKQNLFQSFVWLWNYFFHIRLPFTPDVDQRYIPRFTRVAFPLTGAAAGLVIYLGYLLILYICGSIVATLCFALTGAFLLDLCRKFRGFKLFCTWCDLRIKGHTAEEALEFQADDNWKEKDLTEQLLPFTIYIIRGIFFAILAGYHSAVWVIFALTGSFLVMADLTNLQDERTWNELIPAPEGYAMHHWFAAAAVLLTAGVLTVHPGSAIATFLIAWGMTKYVKTIHDRMDGVITFKQLDHWGYFTELLLLLVGTLFAAH